MKIKSFTRTNDLTRLNDLVGAEFTLENSEYLAFLLDVEEEEEFPLLVSIKQPIEWEDVITRNFEGVESTYKRPCKFEEITVENFSVSGGSVSGSYRLSDLSISRIINGLLEITSDWITEDLNDDESNFEEILNRNGYSFNDGVFLTISDSVANTATVPDESFRETCELRVDWIYRLREMSDEGELFSKERCLGIINYVEKNTKKIIKRNVFLAFYDDEMATCNINQIESLRPSTDEEIYFWFSGNTREPSVIPLLIDEDTKIFVRDSALDFTVKKEVIDPAQKT